MTNVLLFYTIGLLLHALILYKKRTIMKKSILLLFLLSGINTLKSADQRMTDYGPSKSLTLTGALALGGGLLWYILSPKKPLSASQVQDKVRALIPQEKLEISSFGSKDLIDSAKKDFLRLLDNSSLGSNKKLVENFLLLANSEQILEDTAFKAALGNSLGKRRSSKLEAGSIDMYCQQIVDGSFAQPENSYTCGVGQFEIAEAETACAAMALMSMIELKNSKNLDELRHKHRGSLDILLAKGRSLYADTPKQNKYLSVDDLLASPCFPQDRLQKIDLFGIPAFLESDCQTSEHIRPFFNALNFIEQYGDSVAKKDDCPAAAAAEKVHTPLYGLCTVHPETIMIAYYPETKKWILFDSHRKNKYSAPGAGFHQFSSKELLVSYLVGYPLTIASKPVEFNLFS